MHALNPITGSTPAERRDQIAALESCMLGMPQVECELLHHFAPGMYGREIRIPAGTCLTGRVHKAPCIAVLAQGTIHIATEDGERMLTAPHVYVMRAGSKNVGYAVTDVTWVTFHTNIDDTTDELVLIDRYTVSSHDELAKLEATP